jgi:hypothetical protein
MNPRSWLRHRRAFEITLWVLFFLVHVVTNSITGNIDHARMGLPFQRWEPWVWEISSALIWLPLLLLLLVFDRRFPLERPHALRHLLLHAAFTLPVSVLHVLGIVALRALAYSWAGAEYRFGDWGESFLYEYLKDVRTYAGLIAIVYLYRFLLRRWQGQAEFITEGREEEPPEPVTDRFLVKKLGREFLVKVEDIDWIESAANYVILRVGERRYPLRETMSGIEQKLDGRGFARVHRSALVNLDRVKEIEPFDTGDARVHLVSGSTVPVSRRYRQELKNRLA